MRNKVFKNNIRLITKVEIKQALHAETQIKNLNFYSMYICIIIYMQ